MADQHIFISDVHYGGFDPETDRETGTGLTSLIDFCREKRIRLHILGDLFDYWMEYPGHHPGLGTDILEKIRRYSAELGPVTYITGNHDNWTRGYLESCGFDVEHEYRILNTGKHTVFLHHGDGLSHDGFGLPRPRFHRLLRNRYFVSLYQAVLPPAHGLALMKWFSVRRRSGPVCSPGRLNRWSGEYLSKSNVDFVICGHDHIPRIETFPDGTFINTGAFYLHRSAVLYTNDRFELVTWNGDNRRLASFFIQQDPKINRR